MSTSTKTSAKTEIPHQFAESANAYVERLAQSHERLTSAFETARARNARLADKFFQAMVAGQRDALALGKTVIAEPTAYAKNIEAFLNSMSAAQERALDVAKTVYREESDAAGEMRDAAQRAFESAKTWLPAADKLSAFWNPASK